MRDMWQIYKWTKKRDPRSHRISTKEMYDIQGNPWGHGTETYRGLPFVCNCEEVSRRIQAGQGQYRRWHLDSLPQKPQTLMNIHHMFLDDRYLIVQQIAKYISIHSGSVHTVLTRILAMSKLSARWVPRMLMPKHKLKRADISKTLLTHF